MRKILFALAAPLAIALGGCAGLPVPGAAPPAPAAATTIDEKALLIGYQALDTVLVAVDGLIVAGVVVPGSDAAGKIDRAIEGAQTALNAARAARAALSATDYASAMADAQLAFTQLQSLLKGIGK